MSGLGAEPASFPAKLCFGRRPASRSSVKKSTPFLLDTILGSDTQTHRNAKSLQMQMLKSNKMLLPGVGMRILHMFLDFLGNRSEPSGQMPYTRSNGHEFETIYPGIYPPPI